MTKARILILKFGWKVDLGTAMKYQYLPAKIPKPQIFLEFKFMISVLIVGNTFEEAILNLAQLVNQHYGNYREGNQKDAKKAFVKMMTSDLEKLLGEAEIVKE